jgi:hypothetical protein
MSKVKNTSDFVAPKVAVSTTGIYTSGDDFTKVAVVTATRKSTKGQADRPAKGTVNITVFSPTGKVYTRTNVPIVAAPSKNAFFPVPVLAPVETLGVRSV